MPITWWRGGDGWVVSWGVDPRLVFGGFVCYLRSSSPVDRFSLSGNYIPIFPSSVLRLLVFLFLFLARLCIWPSAATHTYYPFSIAPVKSCVWYKGFQIHFSFRLFNSLTHHLSCQINNLKLKIRQHIKKSLKRCALFVSQN